MLRRVSMFDHFSPLSIADTVTAIPTLRQTQGHPTRTKESWQHISTADVMSRMESEGFQLHSVDVQNTRDASRAPYAKHMLRFRMPGLPEVAPGTVPEIMLRNGHDGSSAFALYAGMFRFFCFNGIMVGASWGALKVFHTGNNTGAKVLDASTKIVESFGALRDVVGTWRGIDLSPIDQLTFAHQAMQLRYPVDAETGLVQAPATPAVYNAPRREADTGSDLWSTFNRVQESLTQGGIRGRSARGRATTTRKLTAIDETVRLNQQLFSLAESVAQNMASPRVAELAGFAA